VNAATECPTFDLDSVEAGEGVISKMSADAAPAVGPDLQEGIPRSKLKEGEPFFGHVGDSPVYVLLDESGEIRAFNAVCTHYGAPLADGILADDTIRCPWHHARFCLADGSVEKGPAFNPLARRSVSVEGQMVKVGDPVDQDPLASRGRPPRSPESVVIVGAGAAGSSAAETLRRGGYAGSIHLVDPDPDAPYDRPNLSKDYLAGEAPEDWIPLRPAGFLEEHGIRRVPARVREVDLDNHWIVLENDETLPFGVLLLAPGARPRTLDVPGARADHVHTLRSLADCRAIISMAEASDRAVVVGASFIGLEVAAALRNRGLDVAVVAPEAVPFAHILGDDLGAFIRSLHEDEGVRFLLENTVREIREDAVVLEDGTELQADLVVVGIGVDPELDLARDAGLEVENGIVVDEFLRTSHPDVYAAGDAALYPEARLGERVRIEHWVLARRQGSTAALNMLGKEEPFRDAPFFWTEHYGTPVAYVGHGKGWDEAVKEGSCKDGGCSVAFRKDGRLLALATVFRDQMSLEVEAELESGGEAEVRSIHVEE
jgi:apoptosis-inducing factor 3